MERQSPRLRNVFLTVLALTLVAAGFWGYVLLTSGEESSATETAAEQMKKVKDMPITVYRGPENMRTYKYTGEIEDRVGALPQGKGVAVYSAYGQIPASTYVGAFKDGICEDSTGKARLVFESGDTYEGTFVQGFYGKGRYTLADGSYFEGTFKEGTPSDGKWYNADGSFSATVVNGVEQ